MKIILDFYTISIIEFKIIFIEENYSLSLNAFKSTNNLYYRQVFKHFI